MEKNYLDKEWEVVGVFKREGEWTLEDGRTINYKNYYVEFKDVNGELVMRAKVDKVFNDYVED